MVDAATNLMVRLAPRGIDAGLLEEKVFFSFALFFICVRMVKVVLVSKGEIAM